MNKSIETRTGDVHYEDTGNGFPLVFLHGLCEDELLWENFTPAFANEFRVIRPDFPGSGKSSLKSAPGSVTMEEYAETVFAILKNENCTECAVIGHSMGGYVALAFAEKYPDLLKGLCLFHSSAFADDEAKRKDRQKTIDFISQSGYPDFIDLLYENNFTAGFYKNNADDITVLTARAKKYPKQGAIAAISAMRKRPERLAVLQNAKFPVLFISGKEDKVVPLEKSLQQSHLPGVSSILILENVAHMGMFEAKEKCVDAIAEWLKMLR